MSEPTELPPFIRRSQRLESQTTRYLTIHFAPSTACVTVEISEAKFKALARAIEEHAGDVTLEISHHKKAALKVSQ